MSSRTRWRVSILGLGPMGLRHARVVENLPECLTLVGAYDVRSAIDAPDYVRRLDSEAEAIRSADLVIVATPVEAHAGAAFRALAEGRHVLVEKPLCDRHEQAEGLVSAAARHGARVFVGHSERFNPVVRALARLLRDDPAEAIDLRRMGAARGMPHGVLLNLGVHDFDLACYLGGGNLAIRCALGRGREGANEDIAHVLFETSGGAAGHIYVAYTREAKERAIRILTSRWVYEGDLLRHRLLRTSRDDGFTTEVPLCAEEPLVAQALAFASALRGAPSRELASGSDGARAVILAEVAAAQCRDNSSSGAENLSLAIRA